jgi:DNA adenine methylase
MAARFITLNKTCYNGLYRVNKKGIFNVPFGKYKKPKICDERNIINISNLLHRTKTIVQAADYENILLQNVKKNDFIYLDPPYHPIDETANFTEYTNTGFDSLEQNRLANLFKDLDHRGCKIILSNSDTNLVRDLYKKFKIFEVDVLRSINSKPNRRSGYNELIIRNF